MKKDVYVFFDMDGVLVDLNKEISVLFEEKIKSDPEFKSQSPVQSLSSEDIFNIMKRKDADEQTEDDEAISSLCLSLISNNTKLWVDARETISGRDLYNNVVSVLNSDMRKVYFLTAPLDAASVVGKKIWVNTHYPDVLPGHLLISQEKGQKMAELNLPPGAVKVLIDDRQLYRTRFENAGGVTIKHEPAGSLEATKRSFKKFLKIHRAAQ